MKALSRISVVVTACFLLTSGSWMQAQRGAAGGGGRQGGSASPAESITLTDIKYQAGRFRKVDRHSEQRSIHCAEDGSLRANSGGRGK